MKKFIILLSALIITIASIGCTKDETTTDIARTINFVYQDGTPALTAAKLAIENPSMDNNIVVNYQMEKTPDLLVAKVLKEEADIAIVPSNLAAQAYNKGLPYKIVGTAGWGSFYLASTEDIESFEDLKGKEIYTFGKGLTPDLVLQYVLSNNGIDLDKDIKITYLSAASEVAPAFIGGKSNVALLAEPLLTTVMLKKDTAKVIFDLNQEWAKAAGTVNGYPQASLIIKEDLLENNPDFVRSFIKAYEESRAWAGENPSKLVDYAQELEMSVAKETLEEGFIWTNVESFHINDGKEEYKKYYEAILDFAADFIGGKLPDEGIYFQR